MPTKDELTTENAELKARIAELEHETVVPEDAELVQSDLHGWCWRSEEEGEWPVSSAVSVALDKAGRVGNPALVDTAGDLLEEGEAYVYTEEGLMLAPSEEGELTVRERVTAITTAEVFDAAVLVALEESGENVNSEDDLTEDELVDAVLHVLLRPVTTSDAEAGEDSDTVAMLRADLQRITIERDDARNALAGARRQLADAGSLHGRIDNLPPTS